MLVNPLSWAVLALCLVGPLARLAAAAQPHTHTFRYMLTNTTVLEYHCKSIGPCVSCTILEKKADQCQPFGNKEPLSCREEVVDFDQGNPHHVEAARKHSLSLPANDSEHQTQRPEPPAWGSCLIVTTTENLRFMIFVLLNLSLLIVAGSIVFWRNRLIKQEQHRRIRMRIQS
ncbi:uncharacterized protein BJ171DRAFT_580134 [Polychytrium aggregatum]|uniref:uncharacterized protein n=1 Tax=Polychytrium aggregatum TaxID=110093 RepID=UPI0022FDDA25|nr:uncharacterized protein BJ171DRAFT_580134 [Polychytrium aggregatum]KAI9206061.1 hypothetical protein BJ171DRAFT_580134 [Polychytrium aggregatum]